MAIHYAAKALILNKNRLLVNKCFDRRTNTAYYDLPGGGQHQFESMEEAVVREVLEETGYSVKIIRFSALVEEICVDKSVREKSKDYAHRMLHIFMAELLSADTTTPPEIDYQQEGSIWLTLDEVDHVEFYPKQLTGNITSLINKNAPSYLGCTYID